MANKDDHYFSPLNGEIPLFPIEDLQKIADHVRRFFRKKQRTDQQIEYVQNLICELVQLYLYEDQLH